MAQHALIVLALAAVGVPHVMPLRRASPAVAAAVWLGALALRGLIISATAVFVLVYLPQTGLFKAFAEL